MALSEYLATDELTIVLGLVAAGLFLLHNLYKPQSLVHPILLGRQSDVARVRNPGESAVYRNFNTGMVGRFQTRPTKDQQVLLDLVRPDLDTPRTLWSTKITNPELRQRVSAFGTGLVAVAGLTPGDSNVLLLLNDGIEFLISDLALASHAIPSFTLTSKALLSPFLDHHPPSAIITNAEFLPHLLELIYDTNDDSHHTVIVVGELATKVTQGLGHTRVLSWTEIERQGTQLQQIPGSPADPKHIFTASFYETRDGELHGVQFSHENLTGGVAAVRALLPPSSPISSLDTIISAHSLSTPFGRAVAYTALYDGANFATLLSTQLLSTQVPTLNLADLKSAEKFPIPSPTILFVTPSHLQALAQSIIDKAKASLLLFSFAWRHKMAAISEGFTTKQSLWDRLVLDDARVSIMGTGAGTVRGIIVSGGPLDNQILTPARIALSIPLVNAYTHPLVSGPVLASHALDLQVFPSEPAAASASAAENYSFTYVAPVGPPSINVECKLVNVDDATVEGGGDPVGTLLLRGPTVGAVLGTEEQADGEHWVATEERAKVLPNGTFKVVGGTKI